MIPTFIINLPKSVDRKNNCLKFLEKAGIEGQVFEGIYGKDILESLQNDPNSPYKDKVLLTDPLRVDLPLKRVAYVEDQLFIGEIGCSLSHLRLYEHIVKNNIEYALVLEDDAEVSEKISWFIEQALKKRDLWDVLFISHDSGVRDFNLNHPIYLDDKKEFYIKKQGLGVLDPIFNRRRLVYFASCYIISLKAAKRLLDIGYPVRLPADLLLGWGTHNQLRLYISSPQEKLVNLNNSTEALRSTIDEQDPRKPDIERVNNRFHKIY